jgi:hypothetical protein
MEFENVFTPVHVLFIAKLYWPAPATPVPLSSSKTSEFAVDEMTPFPTVPGGANPFV